MKVLIVDDVNFVRRILERLVSSHSFTTTTADCGTEALRQLRRDPSIQAVVTDLHMPDMSGFDLFLEAQNIERLNDTGVSPQPPFILLTAEQDAKILDMALDCGFMQVMQKPPDEGKLIAQLKSIQEATAMWRPPQMDETTAPTAVMNSLMCPVSTEIPLAADLVTALGTISEATDALISFGDVDGLRRLYNAFWPQLKQIEQGLQEFGEEPRDLDDVLTESCG